jgi:hypothetical protein
MQAYQGKGDEGRNNLSPSKVLRRSDKGERELAKPFSVQLPKATFWPRDIK